MVEVTLDFGFLRELVIVFAVGGVVIYALRAVKLPAVVGLLVAGAAVGPQGLSLVRDAHHVEVLAEIGVVLLLFTIGLELSLAQLLRMWRVLVGAGGGQLLLCIGAVAVIATRFDASAGQGIFLGFLAALSSTAIVLRLFGERALLGAPVGRLSLGILLFQDLCIVPLMLLTPYLAGRGAGASELAWTLFKAFAIVVGVVVAARSVVPRLLFTVVRARSRELFLTLLLVLCLGTAWLTSLAGLSLALGAFLAGLAISESEYSHQAMAEAIPFRDAFGSLFFISVGMLLDVGFLVENLLVVSLAVAGVVAIKVVTATLPLFLLGNPLHISVYSGFALAQIGEFAFVLSRSGLDYGLLTASQYQVFLAASVVSMVLTPLFLHVGERLATHLPHKSLRASSSAELAGDASAHADLSGHVIIAGYGVNGQNVARALSSSGIPYAILEMNPETVRDARARGEPIHFGDCTRASVLELLGIHAARMLVVAISDASSTRQAVSVAHSLNAGLFILVRTRFVSEIEELERLGANEVIPEEFETSIEIFARVLSRFDVPRNVIFDLVGRVRGDMYEMLRAPQTASRSLAQGIESLSGVGVESLLVAPGSAIAGRSLAELELRARTGATVLAVQRDESTHPNPDAAFRLEAGDVVVALGDPRALDSLLAVFDETKP
jgi:CPA2 family monovalent cation:H+ antiporter-2